MRRLRRARFLGNMGHAMKASDQQRPPPETCPVCGEDVPSTAVACPGCGADYSTGWNEEATHLDGVDLPGEPFDHDQFVEREFGGQARPAAQKTIWWVVGSVVLLAVLLLILISW